MPRHTEPNANTVLGNLLQPMLGRSAVRAQNSRAIVDHPGLQPDLLITARGRAPVVVEAEYAPAANVEPEARDRLGLTVTGDRRRIEAAIALQYPEEVGDAADLTAAVAAARLAYCVFTVGKYSPPPEREIKRIDRFPESGWLEGGITDLADLIRLMSLPQLAVDTAADLLQEGIDLAAAALERMEQERPFINPAIARLLGLENVPQTRRMTGAILANAVVFHERISGMYPHIRPPAQVCGTKSTNPRDDTQATWDDILEINYWPIFDIARRILYELPSFYAATILRGLEYTSAQVAATGVENSHDLTGRVFQRLIADRKYLATFYTRPESAALLARLAVARLDGVDLSDAAAIGKLRVGDFACGTGALLSAVYDQIAARHERAGGDPEAIHPVMMEEALYGCDVMPSAVHITSATLSGAQPEVGFGKSRLYTMPYGRLSDGSVAIGSLEFLAAESQITLSNFSDPARRAGGNGDEETTQAVAEVPDAGFDLVIMNPPFTRAGSDWEGSSRDEDAIKQFRGLSTELETQRGMSDRLRDFSRDTCYHGYAGLASAFGALADRKLKPGGVMALVLPLSAAAGVSWQGFRQMMTAGYTELTVVSIAAADNDQLSFSASTNMAECLVVARKLRGEESPDNLVKFVSLVRRPQNFVASWEIANNIPETDEANRIEDGPYDGVNLEVGGDVLGKVITARCPVDGEAWAGVRIFDYSLAQTAYTLADSTLWLPGQAAGLELKIAPLNQVGNRGMFHRNIADGPTAPFKRGKYSRTATYPALWNHDAKNETCLVCTPDIQLRVKNRGARARSAEVWATASRAHLNLDFRFNSQPLAVAFTDRESLGGRAWPNVQFPDTRFDYAFALWSNCTLGLLSFWWHANRQVAGRGSMTISTIETLPILDFRALTDAQLATAQEIFEEFQDKELLPAYLADADPNRALLDKRVVCDLLGFAEPVYAGVRQLAAKWCAEPSVNGGKARPKDARLIV